MSSHTATRKILERYPYLQNASTHVHLLQVSSEPFETGSRVFWAEGLDDAAIFPHIKVSLFTDDIRQYNQRLTMTQREPATKPKLRAFFLDYVEVAPREPKFDLRIRLDTLESLCQSLRINPLVLEDAIDRTGWTPSGLASFVHPGEGGMSDTTQCVYQYRNTEDPVLLGVWFSYDSASALSTYVLWDCPEFTRRGIVSCAQEDPLSFVNTYITSLDTTRNSPSAIEKLVYFRSRNRIQKRYVEQYNERDQLMINLLFNMGTQVDSRTNLQIAKLTSKIAVDAQRDSSSMITIAAVTMVFLPGTFISVRLTVRSCYAPK
ncbi:MAG: hypothetical protein LQ350_003056 [Teloschistes chrysophthalmus]|nr:MAG: hypothetical protein LQ350_003056 [Niorma chrysophthalma]